MFAKILALIMSMGVIACSLLALRQLRLQAVHELAQAQRRVVEHDRTLCRIRATIAARITPERVERLAASLGPLEPILPEPPTDVLPIRVAQADAGVDNDSPTDPAVVPERAPR